MLASALAALLCSQVQVAPGQAPMQPFVLPDGTIPSHVTILPESMMSGLRPVASAASATSTQTASAIDEAAAAVTTASDDEIGSPYFQGSPPVVQPVAGRPPSQLVQYPAPPNYQQPVSPGYDPFAPALPFTQPRGQFDPYAPSNVFRPDQPRILARPDVVGLGKVAVEVGYVATDLGSATLGPPTFATISELDQDTGTGLIRYGLTEAVELRVGGQLTRLNAEFGGLGSADVDAGGVTVGLKWKLAEQVGAAPEFSVLGDVGYLEVDDDGSAQGSVLGLAEWDLGYGFALGLSGGLLFNGESNLGDSSTEGIGSVSLEKRFERTSIFAELAGTTDQRTFAQLGLLVPLGDFVFFDIHGGYAGLDQQFQAGGFNAGSAEFDGAFIGAGFTFYTP